MGPVTSRTGRRFAFLALITLTCVALLWGTSSWLVAQVPSQQPNEKLIALGIKFDGVAGCNNANCHGAPAAQAPPKAPKNEAVTWGEKDEHSKAYQHLRRFDKDTMRADSAAIGQKLGIANPAESPLCTNCHALSIKDDLKTDTFNIREGVTCTVCHGPYQKMAAEGKVLDKHVGTEAAPGFGKWRQAAGYTVLKPEEMPYSTASKEHQKLLADTGLFDTRPFLARAEKCASCHLAIDAKLVEAGHPQPIFELAYYSNLQPPHWRDPGGYWDAKVWLAGQVVCARDAAQQLADRAAGNAAEAQLVDAKNQLLAHVSVLSTQKMAAVKDALKAAGNDKAKLAAAAKSAKDAAEALMPAAGSFTPVEGNTAAILRVIAKNGDIATDAGIRGAEQQSLALASLFSAYVKGKGNVAGADDVKKLIDEKLLASLDPASFKADDFNKALGEVAAKMIMSFPSGTGSVPDPLDLK